MIRQKARLAELLARHGRRDAEQLLAAMCREFPGRLGVISSFGIESALLLDMVAKIDRHLPVLFLDTGELFDETQLYRDTLAKRLGLSDIRHIHPTPAELAEANELWRSDPDRCCALRKVAPLFRAMQGFDALVDGRKRFHGESRARLEVIEQGARGMFKISPLARWSEQQLQVEFEARNLPPHPLAALGYRSAGCWPCSRPARAGDGPRDGRWAGLAKNECGIHLPSVKVAAE